LSSNFGFDNDKKMSRCRQEYDVKLRVNLTLNIFDAFAKLRKATVSPAIPVCLSVCRSVGMKQLGSRWTGFLDFFFGGGGEEGGFFKSSEKIDFC
jgi:hypothetical protein